MQNLFTILLLFPFISFSQQHLWTTEMDGNIKDSDLKTISKEEVVNEITNYYNIYQYYYDGSGFTTTSFKKKVGKYNINKNVSMEFEQSNTPRAIAFKDNDGYGSFVTVLFFNKKNIDAIVFSNDNSLGSNSTSDRVEFTNLINSFWPYGVSEDSDSEIAYSSYSKIQNTSLSLENRHFIKSPQVEDDGQLSGRVAVEITVARSGKIIAARAGVRGTTLNDPELWERCEKLAFEAKLNQLDKAPSSQRGVIMFSFKAK